MNETILIAVICAIIGFASGFMICFYTIKRNCDGCWAIYKADLSKHKYVEKACLILTNYLYKNNPNENDNLEDALGYLGQYLDD